MNKVNNVIGQNKGKSIICKPYVKEFLNDSTEVVYITVADLIADAVASGIPDAIGFLGWEIALKPKGGECTTSDNAVYVTTSADAQVQNAAGTTIRNLDAGAVYSANNHIYDTDCDNIPDIMLDPAEQVCITPGSCVVIGASVICGESGDVVEPPLEMLCDADGQPACSTRATKRVFKDFSHKGGDTSQSTIDGVVVDFTTPSVGCSITIAKQYVGIDVGNGVEDIANNVNTNLESWINATLGPWGFSAVPATVNDPNNFDSPMSAFMDLTYPTCEPFKLQVTNIPTGIGGGPFDSILYAWDGTDLEVQLYNNGNFLSSIPAGASNLGSLDLCGVPQSQAANYEVTFKSSGLDQIVGDCGILNLNGGAGYDFSPNAGGQDSSNFQPMIDAKAEIDAWLANNGGGTTTLSYPSQSLLLVEIAGSTCVMQTADHSSNPGPHNFSVV